MVALWEALMFPNVSEHWAWLTLEVGVSDKRRIVWLWLGRSLFLDSSTSWGEYLCLSCWMIHYVHQLVQLTFVCGLVSGASWFVLSRFDHSELCVSHLTLKMKWTSWPLVFFLAPCVFQTQGKTTTNALTLQLVFPQSAGRDGLMPPDGDPDGTNLRTAHRERRAFSFNRGAWLHIRVLTFCLTSESLFVSGGSRSSWWLCSVELTESPLD